MGMPCTVAGECAVPQGPQLCVGLQEFRVQSAIYQMIRWELSAVQRTFYSDFCVIYTSGWTSADLQVAVEPLK